MRGSQHKLTHTREESRSIVTFQWRLACVGGCVLFFLKGAVIASAFWLGGMAGFVPTLLLYRIFFRYSGAMAAKKMWVALCVGECLKFMLTAAALIVLFGYTSIPSMWVLVGFLMTFLGYWWSLMRQMVKRADE
ncbi:MAG: ATP synthase subunit I [Pseudomonadota bacterium]